MSSQELYIASSSSRATARNDRNLFLSVDDELTVLYTRYKLLAGVGYAVLSACDGVQALGLFDSEKVDLVLVDYALPGMNGGTVAEAIKARMPEVRVVVVSGAEVPDQYLSICDGYVPKADGPELLLRTIRELLFPASLPVAERSQKAS